MRHLCVVGPGRHRRLSLNPVLHKELQSFKPDLIVSIHAPYGLLDFDGPSIPPYRLGRLCLDQVGIFPGAPGNCGGVHKGVPAVTLNYRTPCAHPSAPRCARCGWTCCAE